MTLCKLARAPLNLVSVLKEPLASTRVLFEIFQRQHYVGAAISLWDGENLQWVILLSQFEEGATLN